jgi:tRNA nucleotidyltransferase/poly(A) polymerase
MSEQTATSICKTLKDKGFQAFFAGGCVRDRLIGRVPKDFDVATNAKPDVVMGMFSKTVPVGVSFGVIKVIENGDTIEVATFRSDGKYSDGRRPDSVKFGDHPLADVQRRDFTINGLLYDPIENEISDYVSGQKDIDARVVRCIGDPRDRFNEDALRMVRAVRFACQLGFSLDGPTFDAIWELRKNLEAVSKERQRDELLKILTSGRAGYGIYLLNQSGLLRVITDGKSERMTMDKLGVLSLLPAGCSPNMALAAFAEAMYGPADWLGTMKLSSADLQAVKEIMAISAKVTYLPQMTQADRIRWMRRPEFSQAYELTCLEIERDPGMVQNMPRFTSVISSTLAKEFNPPKLLNGHDLLADGFHQSPKFSEVLLDVETQQLNGLISTREEALEFVRKTYPGLKMDSGIYVFAKTCENCHGVMRFEAKYDTDGQPAGYGSKPVNCWCGGVFIQCSGQIPDTSRPGVTMRCGRRYHKKGFKRVEI